MARAFLFPPRLHLHLGITLLVDDDRLRLLLFLGSMLLACLRFSLILLSLRDLLLLSPSQTVLSLNLYLVHVRLRHQFLLASCIDLWRLCIFGESCSFVWSEADAWLSSLDVELLQEWHHP